MTKPEVLQMECSGMCIEPKTEECSLQREPLQPDISYGIPAGLTNAATTKLDDILLQDGEFLTAASSAAG